MSENSEKTKSEIPGSTPLSPTPTTETGDDVHTSNQQPQKRSFKNYLKNFDKRKQELADMEKRQKEEQLLKEQEEKEKAEEELKKRQIEEAEKLKKDQESKKMEEERRQKELRLLQEIKRREDERKEEENRRKREAAELQAGHLEEQEKKKLEEELRIKQDEIKKLQEKLKNQQEEEDQKLKATTLDESNKVQEQVQIESANTEKTPSDQNSAAEFLSKDKKLQDFPMDQSDTVNNNETQEKLKESSSPNGKKVTQDHDTTDSNKDNDLAKLFDDVEDEEDMSQKADVTGTLPFNKSKEDEDDQEEQRNNYSQPDTPKSKATDKFFNSPNSIRSQVSSLGSIASKLKSETLSNTLAQLSELSSVASKSAGKGDDNPHLQLSEIPEITSNSPDSNVGKFLASLGPSPVKKEEEEEEEEDRTSFGQTSPLTALPSEATLPPSSIERHIFNRRFQAPPSIPEASETSRQSIESPPPDTTSNNSDAVDSEAETVIGDSPARPKRGRLIRKADLENIKSSPSASLTRHIGFNEDEVSEIEHQISRRRPPSSKSQSRSTSPRTANKKRVIRDAAGRSKLQKACYKGKYEEVLRLIEEGADVNDKDFAGTRPIHEAALKGFTDIVELLLEHGANVNARSGVEELDTPLIDAVSNGHLDTIAMLLKHGADPRKENKDGLNALDVLDEDDSDRDEIKALLKEAASTLLEKEKKKIKKIPPHSSDLDDSPNGKPHKTTAENTAASRRAENIIIDLTTKAGRDEIIPRAAMGDVEFVGMYLTNGGRPNVEAFALAAKHGHEDVLSIMAAFGPHVVNAYTEQGTTALMQTLGRNQLPTVKSLLQAGADPTKLTKDGKRSTLDFATDSLIVDDEEIELLKKAIDKTESKKTSRGKGNRNDSSRPPSAAAAAAAVGGGVSDSEKQRKRKGTPVAAESDTESQKKIKKKTIVKPEVRPKNKDKDSAVSPAPQSREMKRALSSSTLSESTQKKSKISPDSPLIQSPVPQSAPTTAATAATAAANDLPAGSIQPAAPQAPTESEEERKARILREKAERDAYEAEMEAKRKARQQEYMKNMTSVEEKRIRQEVETRKREKEEQNEVERVQQLKKTREEKRREIMADKIETARRVKLRDDYPYGLLAASFNEDRTKEDILKYLPLYVNTNEDSTDSPQLVSDLQVLLIIGYEEFYERYASLETTSMSMEDKLKIFNYFYPFLGDFRGEPSTTKQLEDYGKQLAKFKELKLKWLKLEDAMKIIKDDYPTLYDVVRTRTTNIDLSKTKVPKMQTAVTSNIEIVDGITKEEEETIARMAKNKFIPLRFRLRPTMLRALADQHKRLW